MNTFPKEPKFRFPDTKKKTALRSSNRWQWLGTIAVIVALVGIFTYQNPQIWQNEQVADNGSDSNLVNNIYSDANHNPSPIPEPEIIDVDQLIAEQAAQAELEGQEQMIAEASANPADGANTDEQAVDDADMGAAISSQADANPPQTTEQAGSSPDNEASLEQEDLLDQAQVVAVESQPPLWQMPANGQASRAFGYGLDPTHDDYRFHNGFDLDLAVGSPVFAAAGGKILEVEADDLAFGGIITIEHSNGWYTVYKCLEPLVDVGQTINAGDQIGTIINSPAAEAAQSSHLHFEMILDGKYQDPQLWL